MSETPGERTARDELTSRTRIVLRPLAGPLALGFFGLAAGVVGLVMTSLAVYAAYAAEWEDVLKRSVVLLGRRGRGELALTAPYVQQIAELHREPGVRQQL